MKIKIHTISAVILMSLIPTIAYAHEGGDVAMGGFLVGLIHPVLGYDHLLAMLSVGILSAQIGGRAIWTVPAAFVGLMALGGALGFTDFSITSTEVGIAISLVLLGSVIAAERKMPILVAMLGVGFFAIFHGYAHGTEMPETAQPILYALGFLSGTIGIHIAGVVIGDIAGHYPQGKIALRVGGGLIALVGVLLIIGVL